MPTFEFQPSPPIDASTGSRGLVNMLGQSFIGGKRNSIYQANIFAPGNINIDLNLYNNLEFNLNNVATMTLAAPTNHGNGGQSGCIVFRQGNTTPTVLTFASAWKFPGGVVPTLTAAVNAVDMLVYFTSHYYSPIVICQLIKDIK